MTRTTSAASGGGIAAELRDWARGCNSTEAAVELLIRARGRRFVTVRSHSVVPRPMRWPCSMSAAEASSSQMAPAATNRPILNEAALSWWLRVPAIARERR